MRLVVLESPFRADTPERRELYERYLRAAMRDSIRRGEAPMASHRLYTDCLNDDDVHERELGILAGLAWGRFAVATVVYVDYGLSTGMKIGIDRAEYERRPVEYRRLNLVTDTSHKI